MKLSSLIKYHGRINKKYDNTITILTEGTDGYPYVLQTDDTTIDDDKFTHIKSFMDFTMSKLGIHTPVKVTMTGDRNAYKLKTLAHYNNDDSHCVVYSKGRNVADILRSIAHELVHKNQFERGEIGDEPVPDIGGKIEDDANAIAGQLVKEFGYKNPQIFE